MKGKIGLNEKEENKEGTMEVEEKNGNGEKKKGGRGRRKRVDVTGGNQAKGVEEKTRDDERLIRGKREKESKMPFIPIRRDFFKAAGKTRKLPMRCKSY